MKEDLMCISGEKTTEMVIRRGGGTLAVLFGPHFCRLNAEDTLEQERENVETRESATFDTQGLPVWLGDMERRTASDHP